MRSKPRLFENTRGRTGASLKWHKTRGILSRKPTRRTCVWERKRDRTLTMISIQEDDLMKITESAHPTDGLSKKERRRGTFSWFPTDGSGRNKCSQTLTSFLCQLCIALTHSHCNSSWFSAGPTEKLCSVTFVLEAFSDLSGLVLLSVLFVMWLSSFYFAFYLLSSLRSSSSSPLCSGLSSEDLPSLWKWQLHYASSIDVDDWMHSWRKRMEPDSLMET